MPEPYILFQVGDTKYAVPSSIVLQVEMVDKITKVPNAPEFVEGIVYLRGQVVPVISLRKRFHMDLIPYDLRSRLLVVRVDNRVLALAADTAREFVKINEEEIHPTPPELVQPGVQYLQGVVSLNSGLILLIDLRKMLSDVETAESVQWTGQLEGDEHV